MLTLAMIAFFAIAGGRVLAVALIYGCNLITCSDSIQTSSLGSFLVSAQVNLGLTAVALAIGQTITVLAALVILYRFRKLFSNYLNRNVIGYIYLVWYDRERDCIRDAVLSRGGKFLSGYDLEVPIRLKNGKPICHIDFCPFILVGLGGWLPQRACCTDGYMWHDKWRVRLAKINFGVQVTLTDKNRLSLTRDIVHMLQLFCERLDISGTYWPRCFETLLLDLLGDRQKLLAAKLAADYMRIIAGKFSSLIEASIALVEALADPSRICKSREGAKIRRTLAQSLLEVLLDNDSRKMQVKLVERRPEVQGCVSQ